MHYIRRSYTSTSARAWLFATLLLAVILLAGSAAPAHAAAAGTVVAWGRDDYGQSTVPNGLSNVTAIAAGEAHSLALKSDGTVVGWGYNQFGQTDAPVGLSNVTAIAGGSYHSLALKSDGTVVAWGRDELGLRDVPSGLSGVTAIDAGYLHSLALKSDGTVVGWGDNSYGQLNMPVGLSGVTAIAAGYLHNLALKSDGTVVTWGWNCCGQTNVPVGLSNVKAIAAGFSHSLALKSDGTVVAWGYNGAGQLNVPVGLSGVTAIAAGNFNSMALKSDGTVVVWGSNTYGQSSAPNGLSNVKAIAGGNGHSLAIKVVDTTPPVITANTSGTLGNNGWFTSDATVSWSVVDDESDISTKVGCGNTTINSDTTGTALTCMATSVGGTASQAVTIKRDTTAPSISCGAADGAWHASNASIACSASDVTAGLANSADANFNLSTNVPSGTETSNASTSSRVISDSAGNSATAGPISGNKIDKKAPQLTGCAAPDGAWHNADVTLQCTYSDGGAGPASQAITLSTNVPSGSESSNASASANGAQACDAVNNCASTPADIAGNKIDKKAPSINIVTPANTVYLLGQVAAASYTCSDGGSGVATCVGSVASGASLNTSAVGAKTFTVNATDNVGNAGNTTVNYAVGYGFSGLQSPYAPPSQKTFNIGSSIPLLWRYSNAAGKVVNSASAAPSVQITRTTCPGGSSGTPVTVNTSGASGLQYDSKTNTWQYNWNTSELTAGCYNITILSAQSTQSDGPFPIQLR